MASKFLNANTDVNLGNADDQIPSQKAVKTYVDNKVCDGTITINQGNSLKGTFTVNQNSNTTINLDAGMDISKMPNYKTGLGVTKLSTTSFSVDKGYTLDSTGSTILNLPNNITKILDTFEEGNGNGCMTIPFNRLTPNMSSNTPSTGTLTWSDVYDTDTSSGYYRAPYRAFADTTNTNTADQYSASGSVKKGWLRYTFANPLPPSSYRLSITMSNGGSSGLKINIKFEYSDGTSEVVQENSLEALNVSKTITTSKTLTSIFICSAGYQTTSLTGRWYIRGLKLEGLVASYEPVKLIAKNDGTADICIGTDLPSGFTYSRLLGYAYFSNNSFDYFTAPAKDLDTAYTSNEIALKTDIPTVNNNTITIQKNSTDVDSFNLNQNSNKTINITVPTSASDVSALPDSTKYGATLDFTNNVLTLEDQDGTTLDQVTINTSSNINDLSDVNITSPSNNQVLKYDSVSQKWINGTGGSSGVDASELPNYKTGLGVSKTSGTALTVNKGYTLDGTGNTLINLPNNISKTLDTFEEGSGNGCMTAPTGEDPLTVEPLYLIAKDDGTADICIGLTIPSGFTYSRLLGYAYFSNDEFDYFTAPTKDLDTAYTSNEIAFKSEISNNTITIQKNSSTVDTFTLNQGSDKTINITVPTSASDVNALPSSTKYGATLDYTNNVLSLKDQDGTVLSQVTIQTQSATYDSTHERLVM